MAGNRNRRQDDYSQAFEERVIFINRVSKVVKGGKNLGFTAIVAIGDKAGKIGIGLGKAHEVSDAIRKGNETARQNMKMYSLSDSGRTIPHPVTAKFRSTQVVLKPAAPGTGVIAGSTIRAILEALGVRDAVTKVLGSRTAINVAYATIKALDDLENLSDVSLRRNIPVERLKSVR
ncbi:30S ribosomal protein S5 [bacterium]|nr:30S ribosomal protein S5 [bacterium]